MLYSMDALDTLKFPTLHHKFYAAIQVAMTRCAQLPKGGWRGALAPIELMLLLFQAIWETRLFLG